MFVLFVNLGILAKIKCLQDPVDRILIVDGAYIMLINVPGLPLFPGRFIIKFPVMQGTEDLSHL